MMHPARTARRCVAALCLMVLFILAGTVVVQPAYAVTPKKQYLIADKAYAALKKNPRHQKYRDKWMACIEKYERVYQLNPSGPWAAAGLYQSGILYLKLHRHSGVAKDRQAAVDAFGKVIQTFPKSRYTSKSKTQLKRLGQKIPPPRSAVADAHLKKGHAAYQRLLDSKRKQKYRDQWEACIRHFKKAYQTDKTGPAAAESLYMSGLLYKGLAGKSRRESDTASAEDFFQQVIQAFPKSRWAEKARSESGQHGQSKMVRSKTADDPLAGLVKQNQAKKRATVKKKSTPKNGMVTIDGLRFWSTPSYTRIVIDADQETSFSHRLLKRTLP